MFDVIYFDVATQPVFAQSAGVIEYTDCISKEE